VLNSEGVSGVHSSRAKRRASVPFSQILTALLLLVLVGCSRTGQESEAPSSPGAASTTPMLIPPSIAGEGADGQQSNGMFNLVTALLGIAEPKDAAAAFAPSAEQQRVQSCVESGGFQYFIYAPLADDPSVQMTPSEYASTWGLGITAQILGTYPKPFTDDVKYLASLSESEREAYEAVVVECVRSVGVDSNRNAVIQYATEQFRARLILDPRLQAATESWSQCMAASGYEYSSPDEMRQHFTTASIASQASLPELFTAEVRTAVANVPCEATYRSLYSDIVAERFGEFTSLVSSAVPPDDEASG
jgi:hypothetical protein